MESVKRVCWIDIYQGIGLTTLERTTTTIYCFVYKSSLLLIFHFQKYNCKQICKHEADIIS